MLDAPLAIAATGGAQLLEHGPPAVLHRDPPAAPELSKRAVVAQVARRGGPKMIEASLIPSALFYTCLAFGSLGLAYAASILWTYSCLGRHLLRRQGVSGILVLASVGITVRTAIAVGSGSTFVYFAQPIVGTVATGCVFLFSLVIGRPLIGRIAHDFWPITPEQAANPNVRSLLRGLTLLWAGVNLTTATVTFGLLLSLPLTTFVAAKQVTGLAVTITAIAVTIVWSHRTACNEGMVTAPVRT